MFCTSCGNQLPADVAFCTKCGAKMATVAPAPTTTPVTPVSTQSPGSQADPPLNKLRALGELTALVSAIIICLILISFTRGAGAERMVRSVQPFQDIGISASYDQVFNRFLVSPRWNSRSADNGRHIEVSGTVRGTNVNMTVTFLATPGSGRNEYWIEPIAIVVGDNRTANIREVNEIIYEMFFAFNAGWDDLTRFIN